MPPETLKPTDKKTPPPEPGPTATATERSQYQAQLQKWNEENTPNHANDSTGHVITMGDQVNVTATVTAIDEAVHTVTLELKNLDDDKQRWVISGVVSGVVTRVGVNPRIGAAPMLRTPVKEVPAEGGGIKPVGLHTLNPDGSEKDMSSTDGLPTATALKSAPITEKQ